MKYGTAEIAAICGGSHTGAVRGVGGAFIDSRSLTACPGSLFVAVRGPVHDGHDYIDELYRRGTRAFLVERDLDTDKYPEAAFVRVESSVAALQALAADYRSRFRGTVVGITGSNGKTVTKEWIAALVPDGVKLFRSPKSYNSQTGVPLSILMMEGDEDVAVIEAGISQPGEMERLARIVRPDIGIMTNIGDAHQENFASPDEKVSEKLKLFHGVRTIIYNSAYPLIGARLSGAATVDAAAQGDAYAHFDDPASRENAAAALALCDALGYDHGQSVERLGTLRPVAMRLELKEGLYDSLIVNDSYNSDVNSLAIALDYLKNVAGRRRRTLILSDILQSGMDDGELYARVAQMAERSGVDRMVGIGSRIASFGRLFTVDSEFHTSTEGYLSQIKPTDFTGGAVLLKGNRASHFEKISHALEKRSHTTVLEIDLDAMIHNLNEYRRRLTPGTKIMAMVKAAGYGNGTFEIASMLRNQGVDYLAVAFADEGVALREKGIGRRIVVLNADADSFALMIRNALEPEIFSPGSLANFVKELEANGERDYPVHIKLDTGMHRLGFAAEDIPALAEQLKKNRGMVHVSSIFSHLASADEPAQDDFTRRQLDAFASGSRAIADSLGYSPLLHIANSAATERFPGARFDMVRLGIGLYGIGASDGVRLRPVSRLTTRIVQIKELEKGETVGYGREGVLTRKTRTATIPVGYADGVDRRLGCGNWTALVNGLPAPTVGRISMDTCSLDVTGIDVAEGDTVEIFGGDGARGIAAMAKILGTIPYEVMTGVSARVKRVFIKE